VGRYRQAKAQMINMGHVMTSATWGRAGLEDEGMEGDAGTEIASPNEPISPTQPPRPCFSADYEGGGGRERLSFIDPQALYLSWA